MFGFRQAELDGIVSVGVFGHDLLILKHERAVQSDKRQNQRRNTHHIHSQTNEAQKHEAETVKQEGKERKTKQKPVKPC